ncbi:MAG: zinc ribbon domain-containing protein [Acidobacteriales bacterium]|nr:zinc ribbon domain-containing protein [Terriglobales bacterium]
MLERTHKPALETQMIPWWSWLLAIGGFAGIVALMLPQVMQRAAENKSIAFGVFWSVWCGIFVAFYMVMIGYVMRDSRRRGMNPKAWLAIMLALMPSGLGFIVYFLLRSPIVLECPRCASVITPESNFCSRCQHQLKPICEHCQRALRSGDIYCAHCGHGVTEPQQVVAIR